MPPIGLSTSRFAQTKPRTPKLWLLLVGVKEYNDLEIPSLNYSADDCQGLADALVEATTEFSQTELKIHHDFAPQGPLLENIRYSLQKIATAAQSIDTILFYFSGHGILESSTQQAFLCLADTQKSDLQNTGLALKEILQVLGSSAAQNQLVWLDACHSGGLTLRNASQSSWVNPTSELVNVLQKQAAQSKGFYALLSCDKNQQSWEFSSLGHGVFTYYLIRGLQGEAADSQGVISADGLYRYVYHQTLQYIDKTNQQLRLINQQRRNKGKTQLEREYPLQTPKRIVESVGELILGKQLDSCNFSENSRIGVVVEGIAGSKITLEISKLLRSTGSFQLEYLPATKINSTEMRAAITRHLQDNLQQDSEFFLLYLRGKIEETEAGEWLLLGENICIKRSWLKQHLRRISGKQIVILDCPTVEILHPTVENTVQTLKDWVEDLQIDSSQGQVIIAYASPSTEPELFARVLLETLSQNPLENGLSAAGMITKLQLSLADSGIPLYVSLSGTQGIIEVLPATSDLKLKATQGLDLGICPYMGLSAFCESDSQYFYGREDLTQLLINQTANTSFMAVVGASGSGKSSIVQAGLIPALRQGKQIPNSQQWLIKTMRPGANPLETLAQKLMGTRNGEWGMGNREKIKNSSDHFSPALLMEGILNLGVESFVYWIRYRPEPVIVLVVDQFEELFTLARAPDREKFLELLLGAVQYAGDRFKLIVTLRADFIASCLEVETLAKLLQSNSILIPPRLSVNDYRRIIINPARQVGLKVEPELVEVLLRELNNSAGDLPLLEFVLEQLWHHRINGALTLKAYQEKLGGISGALERSSQIVYESLDPTAQECAKWIFLSLTQLGEGTEDTRRRVYKSELIVQKYPTQLVERTLNAFTSAKLVVMNLESEEEGIGNGEMGIGNKGETLKNNSSPPVFPIHHSQLSSVTVEVAHEILLRHWSTLRWWLEENRARLRAMRQIEQATQLWKQNNQQADFLLQGVRLAEAEDIYIKYTSELSPDVQEFIADCLSERKRLQFLEKSRIKQKQRNIFALSILGITTVSFGALGYQQLMTAQLQAVEAANFSSKFDLLRNQQLEGLITSVKAGKLLKNSFFVNQNIKLEILNTLQKAFSNIQERNRLQGHSATVTSVAFSPDGQSIASASDDKTVIIWRRDGKLVYKLKEHKDAVKSISFNHQGNILATASFDKTVKLWNTSNGKLIRTLTGHKAEVMSVSFSPDNSILATGSNDNTIKIWRVNDGKLLDTLKGHKDIVRSLAFSSDGKFLASGSGDNTINIWQVNNRRLRQTLRGHSNVVTKVAISSNNKILASASADKTVKIWDFTNGKLINTLTYHTGEVTSLAFSPDGKTLVTADNYSNIILWNPEHDNAVAKLMGHTRGVFSVNFSPDGQSIISGGSDQTVRIWSQGNLPITVKTNQGQLYSANINPQSNLIATAGEDTKIKLWQLPLINSQRTLPGYNQSKHGHSQRINSLAWSPNGKLLASASKEQYIKLWRTSDDYMEKTLTNHQDEVNNVSFSPQGDILASASNDKTVKLWQIKEKVFNSTEIRTLEGHTEAVRNVVFSPKGDIIASASMDKTIKIWRVKDGKLLQTLTGHNSIINSVSFNPTGDTLVSGSFDKTLILWKKNLQGKFAATPYKTLVGHRDSVLDVKFSPDGKLIASASQDREIKLWNNEGREMQTLFGNNVVTNINFSSDGKMLVSASDDGTMKLWLLNRRKLQTLDLDNLLVRSCDWLQDYLKNNPQVSVTDQNVCSK